jgi:hypothetical protein
MWRAVIVVVFVGCTTQSAPRATTPDPSEGASVVQDELDNIARCFHDSVSLLQRQPEQGESLSDFLAAGEKARAASQQEPDDGFAGLRRNATWTAMVVGADAVVRFGRDAASHDDYADGHSTWSWTYRFTAEGRSESAETVIGLSVGEPADDSQ